MDATLKDGILSICINTEDYTMNYVFTAGGADTSSMTLITAEGYAAQADNTKQGHERRLL